jgi:two-component system, response regulator, stage 0 sporulation protein F
MKRILLVDDDDNICLLYKTEFEADGYEVVVANDGNHALGMLEAEDFDLVILDIRMPGMDGISALEKIAVKKRDLPVLINSAYSNYKDNFLTWLAEDYIIKSADLSELKAKIKSIFEKK